MHEPRTSARQAYSMPRGAIIRRKTTVIPIFTNCSAIPEAAFLYTRRTAEKYPENTFESAMKGRLTESARRESSVRASQRIFFAIAPEKEKSRSPAPMPKKRH